MTPREQIKQMLEQAKASKYGEVCYDGPMPGDPNVNEVHYRFGIITDDAEKQEEALEQFRKDFLKKLKVPSGTPTINVKIEEPRILNRQRKIYYQMKQKILQHFHAPHFFFIFSLSESA